MPKKRKRRNKKKWLFSNGLVKIAAAAIVALCVVLIVTIESECAEKEAELLIIQKKISVLEAENMDIQRILDNTDLSAYMEKVAMEEQGYAYPDEIRFYDTSRY